MSPLPRDDHVCDSIKVMEESVQVVELRLSVCSLDPAPGPLSASLVSRPPQMSGVSYLGGAPLLSTYPRICSPHIHRSVHLRLRCFLSPTLRREAHGFGPPELGKERKERRFGGLQC